MRTADFNYDLPQELIAQEPTPTREGSRMIVVHRETRQLEHRAFKEFPGYLREGDVLVLNDSRVVPARLRGMNEKTGGRFELLLLEESGTNYWWAMMRPGKRARPGTKIRILDAKGSPSLLEAEVTEFNDKGHRRLKFSGTDNLLEDLEQLGEVPLPPYISRPSGSHDEKDKLRYQTVFAKTAGSVAAPTAGLHFSEAMLGRLRESGIRICFVTLHVGAGTFLPVKVEDVEQHRMHEERFDVPGQTAREVTLAHEEQRRVIAVGTTSLRVLESAWDRARNRLPEGFGRTRLFVYPPREFAVVNGLLTNFHLPMSTLLMLVSAFAAPGETAGKELVLKAYQEAIAQRYRFFSYGDAMLLL